MTQLKTENASVWAVLTHFRGKALFIAPHAVVAVVPKEVLSPTDLNNVDTNTKTLITMSDGQLTYHVRETVAKVLAELARATAEARKIP